MDATRLGVDGSFHTRRLTPEDLDALQDLFERCRDYFEIATGVGPRPDESRHAYVGGPPDKSVNDKRTIGVFSAEDELVGVLDAITNWPADGVWTMGLLLLDPERRGAGLGRAVLDAYEHWSSREGARRFHTAVVASHSRGIRFLESMGYAREGGPGPIARLSKAAEII